ncbi:MAG: hypothetical protein K2O67_03225, partial [Clostridia bacterium]|nr:hypothetical protein [Clostridia bacterium]
DIGRARILRAGEKIKKDNPEKTEFADFGFKTYTLEQPDKDTLDKLVEFNPLLPVGGKDILGKFGIETVLSTWKIRDGYGFNSAVQAVDLKGYTAYLLTNAKVGTTLYLIDDMPEEAIKELIRKIEAFELNTDRIIEYGFAFEHVTNTALRTNLKTLKNRNPIEPVIRY